MAVNTYDNGWSVKIRFLPESITTTQLSEAFHIPVSRLKISKRQQRSTNVAFVNNFNSENAANDFVDQWSGSNIFGTSIRCNLVENNNNNPNETSSVLPKSGIQTDRHRTQYPTNPEPHFSGKSNGTQNDPHSSSRYTPGPFGKVTEFSNNVLSSNQVRESSPASSRPKTSDAKGGGRLRPTASQHLDPDDSSDTDKTGSVCSRTDDDIGKIFQENAIFISALPWNMPEQLLFETLWDEFSHNVGAIKIDQRTEKPCIHLFKKYDKTQLNGTAKITFEREESTMKAIKQYNGKRVPILNNAQIRVEMAEERRRPTQLTASGIKTHDNQSNIFSQNLPKQQPSPQPVDKSKHLERKGSNNRADDEKTPSVLPKSGVQTDRHRKQYPTNSEPHLNDKSNGTQNGSHSSSRYASSPFGKVTEFSNNVLSSNQVRESSPASSRPKTSESKIDTEPKPVYGRIWIQFEGRAATKVMLKIPSDIDDLKEAGLKGQPGTDLYEAYYINKQLGPGEPVPLYTTDKQPVVLKKIIKSQLDTVIQTPRINSEESCAPAEYHIIIDNSNVFLGSQLIHNNYTGLNKINPAIRLNVKSLAKVLEADKLKTNITTRIVGGSIPSKNARAWEEWGSCDYKCILGHRSADGKETFLDNMLHAQIYDVILSRYDTSTRKQVLVLVTGDGNTNKGQTNFPNAVERALIQSWHVELWSWEHSLSQRFSEIQKHFPTRMTIKYLDRYRDEITFEEKTKQN